MTKPPMTKPPMTSPLVIVAAAGRNGAIGRDGALPWTMPGDLARFRALTAGCPMIMGRRTWESIGRNLPGRESIVVSRRALDLPEGAHAAPDPDAALVLAAGRAAAMAAPAVALIGGAALFAALMPRADRLAMTFVDLRPEADTFLPPIDPYLWRESARIVPARHPRDEAACVFVDYARADSGSSVHAGASNGRRNSPRGGALPERHLNLKSSPRHQTSQSD